MFVIFHIRDAVPRHLFPPAPPGMPALVGTHAAGPAAVPVTATPAGRGKIS